MQQTTNRGVIKIRMSLAGNEGYKKTSLSPRQHIQKARRPLLTSRPSEFDIMKKNLLPVLALLGAATAQEWTVQFYQGISCTGTLVGEAQDFAPERECRTIENPGFTSALLFSVPESASGAWNLALHDDISCFDEFDAGSYELFPGSNPICIQTFGASRFAIEPSAIPVLLERSPVIWTPSSSDSLSMRAPGTVSIYDKRQVMVDRYGWLYTRVGGFGAFAIAALETCPSFADAGAPNALICGIGATVSIMFAVLTADEVRRSLQRPVNSPVRRSGDLYADILGLIDDVPFVSDEIVAGGIRTTISKLPGPQLRRDDGEDPLLHALLQFDRTETGEHWEAAMDFDPRNNHTVMTSNSKNDHHRQHNNGKRQSSGDDFTAYYSYFDFDQSVTLPISDILAEQLGEELWNYGRSQNVGGYCANLAQENNLGVQQSLNTGFYALISGLFTDQSPNCPP